jgi:hypothetical protein
VAKVTYIMLLNRLSSRNWYKIDLYLCALQTILKSYWIRADFIRLDSPGLCWWVRTLRGRALELKHRYRRQKLSCPQVIPFDNDRTPPNFRRLQGMQGECAVWSFRKIPRLEAEIRTKWHVVIQATFPLSCVGARRRSNRMRPRALSSCRAAGIFQFLLEIFLVYILQKTFRVKRSRQIVHKFSAHCSSRSAEL